MEDSRDKVERVHIWVTGRVQNVGFRAFVQEAALIFDLRGWVRNVGYSQVETVAEGTREKLERFAETVVMGPRAGRVDESKIDWETTTGEYTQFSVRSSR